MSVIMVTVPNQMFVSLFVNPNMYAHGIKHHLREFRDRINELLD